MGASASLSDATETLAAFASEVSYAALPDLVVGRLKECLLDLIGISAFASRHAESSGPFRSAVQAMVPDGGTGTVIGEARGYPPAHAALLNGAYAHTLDFDDTNLVASLHPGAPVVPAAMAVAEQGDASGRDLIEALAAGYEVSCRVGAALGPTTYERGFHITAVAGIFGAVVAAAKIRKSSATVVSNALGIAGSRACGSMQYLQNGAWNKRLHPGFAAHDAVLSLMLAEAGTLGACAPLEGQFGILRAYSGQPDPPRLTASLGETWLLTETAIKPYPSCRFAHAAVDLALSLRDQVPEESRAKAKLRIRVSQTAMNIVGVREANKLRPTNIVEAQFSIYFQVAVAWLDGRFDWQSYGRIGQGEVEALAEAMVVEVDPDASFAGAELSVSLDGGTFSRRADEPLGEPGHPLSWEQLERRFMSMAGPVYGADTARALGRRIRHVEEEAAVAPLIRTLRGCHDAASG